MSAPDEFIRQVHQALNHLYDPDILRAHPLISALGLNDASNTQAALRKVVLDAIESLKPLSNTPAASRMVRVYKLLQFHFVQQLDQEQTAHQLGLSVRHLRREQQVAVETLADALYQKYGSKLKPAPDRSGGAEQIEDELSWLKTFDRETLANVGETLQAALQVVAPLAATRRVTWDVPFLPGRPPVLVHPAGLRQAIVSLTSYVIGRVPGGTLSFTARQQDQYVMLEINALGHGALEAATENAAASLDAARAILAIYTARLTVTEQPTNLVLAIILPIASVVNVLLIDDNADIAQLFDRFVTGTRYRLHHAPSAEHLFEQVTEHAPQAIIIDVMMPGVDGWEILGRLKQHPHTSKLPVIVCTVLPERDLAVALGATEFLPKPVTRFALLEVLNRVQGEESTESR